MWLWRVVSDGAGSPRLVPRIDQYARIGMVDNVHVDRHPLALGEQVGNEDWRNGD
jgi:hypothetical protein